MPQKIINDQGDEIEVFTNEELEQQKASAIEEYKINNPDKSADITKLQEEKAKIETELKGLKDKDFNFANVRKALSDKDEEIKKLTDSIDVKIQGAKKEILEGVMKDHYIDTIKGLAGEDKQLLEKIEYQYKRLADPASTKEEVEKKLNDAFVLATGNKPSFDGSAFSSVGAGRIQVGEKPKLSPEEQDLLNKLANAGNIKIDNK